MLKDKKLFKTWWFWIIVVVIVLAVIGSFGIADTNTTTNNPSTTANSSSGGTLPMLNAADYKGKEGLVAYKELRSKGYAVDAEFEKQALTDINGKASDVFESLDPNKPDDRLSVDAFVVGSLTQNNDSVKLVIVLQPKNS